LIEAGHVEMEILPIDRFLHPLLSRVVTGIARICRRAWPGWVFGEIPRAATTSSIVRWFWRLWLGAGRCHWSASGSRRGSRWQAPAAPISRRPL